MEPTDFDLRGDHITLEALVKAAHLATGVGARTLIVDGGALVNGEVELRRGRKVRAGDEVAVGEQRVKVRAAASA